MSGRAGRRGLDTHGMVIIAGDDLIDPSRLEAIILGQPPKLVSQFGMTYSMLLNLIRNPDRTSYAQMISQSFAAYRARTASAQLHSARDRLEAQLAALPLPTSTPRRALPRASEDAAPRGAADAEMAISTSSCGAADAEMAISTSSRGAADAEMAISTISCGAAGADAAVESGGGGNHGDRTQSDAIRRNHGDRTQSDAAASAVQGGGGKVTIERTTLAMYYDQLEAATNTALDLIRAARSLPGGGAAPVPLGSSAGYTGCRRRPGRRRSAATIGGASDGGDRRLAAAARIASDATGARGPSAAYHAGRGRGGGRGGSFADGAAGAAAGAADGPAARLVCADVDVGGGLNGSYRYSGRSNQDHRALYRYHGCRSDALPDRVAGERRVAASSGRFWSGIAYPRAPTMAPTDAPRVRLGRRQRGYGWQGRR